jgi:hypothetical protein
MSTHLRVLSFTLLLLLFANSPAFADLTAFVGANVTPSSRAVRGIAFGMMLVVVGFEFEYSDTTEDETELAPSLRSGMGNLVVQTPFPVSGLQFYGTIGGGFYREALDDLSETNVAGNVGGGVKISLAGPLKARLDYRVFNLRGDPLHAHPQRVYAGLNLAF